ncbi:MAG: ABC transporter permease subunit, partial [Pseudomonadota bacterium]
MTARFDTTTLAWLALLCFTILALFAFPQVAWLKTYPEALTLPVQAQLNVFMDAVVAFCGPFFRAVSAALDVPMGLVRDLLAFLPWPVTVIIFTGLAWAATGWRLAAFTLATMLYMLVIGYWAESMNSLALVAVSVPAAVMIGFGFGTLGFFSERARKPIEMLLDLLQTVPAFAYLLPILLLFGFGPVVGLIASVMYAFPPMVRNTILGLSRVGSDVIESGAMSGATPGQLFWQVRVPSAKRQLLLGVNQTTMAAFSMVIIASIIGGTADIGWEVLSTMRKAQFGESLLAGIVIALMAMVMDRITAGFASRDVVDDIAPDAAFYEKHPVLLITAIAAVTAFVLAQIVPALKAWPEAWEFYPADILNNAVTWLTVTYAASIALIKQYAFFFLMLPLKIGLKQTISPFSWGFEFTPTLQAVYVIAAASISLLAA